MKERIVHQWRDWLLKYVCDGEYELIKKEDSSAHTITAKNDMDAENQGQLIIKNVREGHTQAKQNEVET